MVHGFSVSCRVILSSSNGSNNCRLSCRTQVGYSGMDVIEIIALRRTTISSALKQVAPTEGQHETGEVLRSAQVPRKLNEVLLDLHATAGALYCNIAPV